MTIAIKCPECGEVSQCSESAVCPYCGLGYIDYNAESERRCKQAKKKLTRIYKQAKENGEVDVDVSETEWR